MLIRRRRRPPRPRARVIALGRVARRDVTREAIPVAVAVAQIRAQVRARRNHRPR